MMTTEEVNAYLLRQKELQGTADDGEVKNAGEEGLQPSEQANTDGAAGSTTIPKDGDMAETETDDAGEKPGDGEGDKASSQSGGKPDGDEKEDELARNKARWANSFRKEKEKRKRQQANYENRIRALEKELSDYKTKMAAEGFDRTSDDGLQTLIDRKSAERELSRLEEEQAEMQMAEDLEENERRIANCFPDEKDQAIYKQLVQNSGKAFADKLARYDEDNVIISGLDDCEISPIVIRVLMTRPEFLNEILSKRTRHAKELAFDSLVNRLRAADKVIRSKKANKQPTQSDAPKGGLNAIKTTGKQSKASSASDVNPVKDATYWNRYLEEHSR